MPFSPDAPAKLTVGLAICLSGCVLIRKGLHLRHLFAFSSVILVCNQGYDKIKLLVIDCYHKQLDCGSCTLIDTCM